MDNIQTKKMYKPNQEITEIFTKYGVWLAYVLMGFVGKFGWDIITNKKITFKYILGSGLCAAFVGYLASVYCMRNAPTVGSYIVPVCTLVSRDIILFLMTIKWNEILEKIFIKKP